MLSPTLGRLLSAVGAVVVAVALVLTWYHIDRTAGATDTTGWQTFTRLRWLVLAGAAVVLATALVRQTRPVLIARTVVGVVLALLILRRIVDPPDIDAPISSQFGVYVGLVAAIAVALGGLVDSGRRVVETYPELAFWRPPAGVLGPGGPEDGDRSRFHRMPPAGGGGGRGQGATVDSTAEEL
jgi:peptidoglycan/LPS O-acetylase OafA/YrhL